MILLLHNTGLAHWRQCMKELLSLTTMMNHGEVKKALYWEMDTTDFVVLGPVEGSQGKRIGLRLKAKVA